MLRCGYIAADYDGEILLSYSEWHRRDGNIEICINPKIEPIDDEI